MRIAEKPWWQYRWYLRPFFWNQRRKYGQVLKSALLWGRSPRVFLGVAWLYGALERKGSPLEPALRSLLSLRVAQLNACRFCGHQLGIAGLAGRLEVPERGTGAVA